MRGSAVCSMAGQLTWRSFQNGEAQAMDMRHSTAGQERRWPIGALERGARSPGVPVPTTADEVLEEHERQRRRRLVRILTLGLMIPSLLLIPSALFPKFILGSLLSLLIVLAGTVAAFILYRPSSLGIATNFLTFCPPGPPRRSAISTTGLQ